MVQTRTARDLRKFIPLFGIAALFGVSSHWQQVRGGLEASVARNDLHSLVAPGADSAGLFNSNINLETAQGERVSLASTAGRMRLVSMIYGHCPGVCPATVQSMQQIYGALPVVQRAKLQIILLSLDPERDSPAALRNFATDRHINGSGWLLARTSPADLTRIATFLGVRTRPLSDGSIDHSVSIALIDAAGRVVSRTSEIGGSEVSFNAAVRAALTQESQQ